jgi:hypothetical protein
MLKFMVDSIDGLDDSVKALYEQKDGKYQLKVEGLPDVAGLKAKVDELLDEKKAEAEKRRQAEEAAKLAKEEKAKKEGDYKSLYESYESKLSELQNQIKERDERAAKSEIERHAMALAADLAEGPNQKILSRFIADRLRYEDGVKVTDKDGKLTISNLDQLKEEFRTSSDFAALVIGSKATGGGASGQHHGGAVKKFTEMNEQERVNLYRTNPAEYARLRDADKT